MLFVLTPHTLSTCLSFPLLSFLVPFKVDNKDKYLVVMVREALSEEKDEKGDKKPFWFLTVYDAKAAMDYQCGVSTVITICDGRK